jgi:hypothetical protein
MKQNRLVGAVLSAGPNPILLRELEIKIVDWVTINRSLGNHVVRNSAEARRKIVENVEGHCSAHSIEGQAGCKSKTWGRRIPVPIHFSARKRSPSMGSFGKVLM